ncbi:MAG: lamin tail domain-containing protein [Candidatus Stygibacter frigidus]|nr:lamin tail domain-containing protein [Candidatus Stygibacter frigidus]
MDFSSNNLVIEKGVNGAPPAVDYTLSSEILSPGSVIVIGTSDLLIVTENNGSSFFLKPFNFNGNDALVVKYGGVITDVFGEPETDPGTGWSGSGVQTYNQNIQLIEEITVGDTDGWTDPSERFQLVSASPSDLNGDEGFGIPPAGVSPSAILTISHAGLTETNLNGASISLFLEIETFSGFDAGDVTLNNVPTGASVNAANNLDDTHSTVTLSFDGTDFDSDITNFNITIAASGITGATEVTSNNLTIIAIVDSDPEPDNHVTGFDATENGSSSIILSWVDATGTNFPSGYLIMMTTADDFTEPVDGTPVADDTNNLNVAYDEEIIEWTGLDPDTQYFFIIFPYSNSGSNIDYKTDSTVPTTNATTESIPIFSLPYTEDFTGQNGKGATGDSNSGTTIDLVGVNWTIDVGGTLETDMSTNYFFVENEEFVGIDVDGSAYWFSPLIDVTTVNLIDLSLDLDIIGGGANTTGENFTVYYSLDPSSGTPSYTQVIFYDQNNSSNLPESISETSIEVSTSIEFEIRIEINSNGGSDGYSFDNIAITPTGGGSSASLEIAYDGGLTETNFDGAVISLILNDETFSGFESSDVALNNAPDGVFVNSVTGVDDASSGTVTISFDGTDFDSDITNFSITIAAAGLDGDDPITSDNLIITALQESITLSTSSLSGFTYIIDNGPSEEQPFAVEGTDLKGNIIINAPTNYEISETSCIGFENSITLRLSDGLVTSTIIYTRLKSGLSIGDYNEDISCSSFDAVTKTITCSGNVSDGSGGGLEDFTNFSETGTNYMDGSFTGQDGSTWTYTQCRGDKQITGPAPCLGKNRNPIGSVYSGSISGDIGTLSFDYMQAFSSNVNMNILINGGIVETVTTSNQINTVLNSGIITINQTGSFVIKFEQVNTSSGQVSIDNVTWTGFSGGEIPSIIISHAGLTESNLDGAVISLLLENETFDAGLLSDHITLNNEPAGTSINSVLRTDDTHATASLIFDGTDFDSNITDFSITVLASGLAGTEPVSSNDLIITAVVEPDPELTISHTGLTESNLNGASVTLVLEYDTFSDFGTEDITLNNVPSGTSINTANNSDDISAIVSLIFDGTDFDSNITDFSITVLDSGLAGAEPVSSNDLIITAVVEPDPEPDNHVTEFDVTENGSRSVILSWTDAIGTNLPSGYLIMMKTADSFTAPVDGTPVADDTNNLNVAYSEESTQWTGLDPDTQYFFIIFPYSNSGSNIDYKTDDSAPVANATTLEEIAHCSFEDSDDTWNYTGANNLRFTTWGIVTSIGIYNPTEGVKLWGAEDLDNLSTTYLEFDEINIVSYASVQIIFDYFVFGYDSDDDIFYSIKYNDTDWSETQIIDGFSNLALDWTTCMIDVPNEKSSVQLRIRLYQDGSDYAGIDNIIITGTALDNLPPQISNITISPSEVITSSNAVSISADAIDLDGTLENVELHWGTSSGSLTNIINMSNSVGDTYTTDTDIPAQTNGVTVYYQIKALDDVMDITASSEYSYTVTDPSTTTLDYGEDFDDGFGDIYTIDVAGDACWTFDSDNDYVSINGYFDTEDEDWLILPGIDFSSYSNVNMTFDLWWQNGNQDTDNYLKLLYSTDYLGLGNPSGSWVELFFAVPEIYQNWTETSVTLASLPLEEIYIAFKYASADAARAWHIDNISIIQSTSSVVDPSLFTASAAGTDQIELSWSENTSENDVLIAWNSSDTFGTLENGSAYVSGTSISNGGTSLGTDDNGGYNHASLTSDTQYFYKIWSVDGSNNYSEGVITNASTYKEEPSNQAANFAATANGTDEINLTWTDNDGAVIVDSFLVLANQSGTFTDPVDGTAQNDDYDLSDGSAIRNINHGTQGCSFSGLPAATIYYFTIYAYTNNGTAIDYNLTDAPADNIETGSLSEYSPLIISEVVDAYDDSSYKFVEIYNPNSTSVDLASGNWTLARQANAGNVSNISLTGILLSNGVYIIASNETVADYDQLSGNVTGNGNDGYFLYYNDTTLVDAFGVIDQDGSGEPWEYTNRVVTRNNDITEPTITWNASEWTFTSPGNIADATPGSHTIGDATTSSEIIDPSGDNTGNFEFPEIGDVSIVIENTEGSNIEVVIAAYNSNYPGVINTYNGYWDISLSGNTHGIDLRFTYNEEDLNGITEADLAIYHFNGSTWENLRGNVYANENYIELLDYIGSFSPFTLGNSDDAPLPDSPEVPEQFGLLSNYPNPFNPKTTIRYNLPVSAEIILTIYNIKGAKIKILDEGNKSAGYYQVSWDGTNMNNEQVSSGIYFYELVTPNFVKSRSMLLIK